MERIPHIPWTYSLNGVCQTLRGFLLMRYDYICAIHFPPSFLSFFLFPLQFKCIRMRMNYDYALHFKPSGLFFLFFSFFHQCKCIPVWTITIHYISNLSVFFFFSLSLPPINGSASVFIRVSAPCKRFTTRKEDIVYEVFFNGNIQY